MIHQRLKLARFLVLATILAASLPAIALEAGKAEGTVSYKGKSCALKYALAVDRVNEFNPRQREIVLFLSDAPISLEGVKSDDVQHEVAYLEITFEAAGKAVYTKVGWSSSEAATGDGINFEGTLDAARKKVSGKVFTKGKVDIYGDALEYAVTFEAPIQKL
jgi:hypothetical protein